MWAAYASSTLANTSGPGGPPFSGRENLASGWRALLVTAFNTYIFMLRMLHPYEDPQRLDDQFVVGSNGHFAWPADDTRAGRED